MALLLALACALALPLALGIRHQARASSCTPLLVAVLLLAEQGNLSPLHLVLTANLTPPSHLVTHPD